MWRHGSERTYFAGVLIQILFELDNGVFATAFLDCHSQQLHSSISQCGHRKLLYKLNALLHTLLRAVYTPQCQMRSREQLWVTGMKQWPESASRHGGKILSSENKQQHWSFVNDYSKVAYVSSIFHCATCSVNFWCQQYYNSVNSTYGDI